MPLFYLRKHAPRSFYARLAAKGLILEDDGSIRRVDSDRLTQRYGPRRKRWHELTDAERRAIQAYERQVLIKELDTAIQTIQLEVAVELAQFLLQHEAKTALALLPRPILEAMQALVPDSVDVEATAEWCHIADAIMQGEITFDEAVDAACRSKR